MTQAQHLQDLLNAALKEITTDGCERCQDMTPEQLCNQLGHYRRAALYIQAFLDGEIPHKTLDTVVREAIDTLKEALAEDNN